MTLPRIPRRAFLAAAVLAAVRLGAAPDADALRKRALDGETAAQLELADEFFFGRNRPANPALAAYWYRRAANSGSPEGEYNLGACYEHGWGVRKSPQQAFECYSRAAEKGSLPARTRRALLLISGIPAEDWGDARYPERRADPETALAELRRAAENYAPAKLALALHLHNDPKKREEHASEIGELARAAAETPGAGAEAMLFYADCLSRGFGMDPDPKRAAQVLGRAIQAGSASALSRLGRMLEFGLGVPPNPERALELYREAAQRNDPAGMTRLGDHYLSGNFVSTDPVQALELYRKAADAKYPPAFAKLGDCLAGGWGAPADAKEAFLAYETGAKLGDAPAQYRLARCFAEGKGTVVDPAAAAFWYKCAASLGSRDAVRELGRMLLHGRGVPADPAEGKRLLQAAASAGDREAEEELERL